MRMSNFVKKHLILSLTCIGLLFSSLQARNWRDYRTGVISPTPEEIKKFPKYRIAPTLLAQALPTAVDNSDGLPPVGDQGGQNSCVAFAVGYYAITYQEGREHGWDLTLDTHQFSPAFLYNNLNFGKDEGTYNLYAMDFIAHHGCATLAEMPYNQEDYLSWPSANVYKNALQYRGAGASMIEKRWNAELGRYENYSDEDLTLMKHILADGNVFVVEIPMDSVFGSLDSINDVCDTLIYVITNIMLSPVPKHSLCVVGYDDTKGKCGAFKVVSSWGIGWGKSGFGWLGYNAIKTSGANAYVMENRVDYTPTAYARVNLNQAHRGDLRLTLYAMDSNTQIYTDTFFENYGGDNPGFDWYIDISDLKNFLPPDANHRYILSLVDMQLNNHITSLNDFYIEYQGSVYRPEQDSFEGIDFGLSQTSIAGANVPDLSPISGYMGGIIPKKLSPYLAVSSIHVMACYTKPTESLTIEPGTTIFFADSSLMYFYGTKAYIKGTETDSVRLLPFNEKPFKGIWKGLQSIGDAEIEYCDIQYATNGIYFASMSENDPVTITIKNCSIRECGIGIYLYKSPEDATIISGNRLEQNDVGIGSDEAKYLLKNNLIVSNDVVIHARTGSTPKVVNNTIVGNYNRGGSGGVYLIGTQNAELRNNIIAYNNIGISGINANGTVSDYNDVWSNLNGATNYDGVSKGAHDISVDPQFIDFEAGDFRLKRTSPCLDAGDPASDYSNEPEPNGGRINLGAYGNTIWATSTAISPKDTIAPSIENTTRYEDTPDTSGPYLITTEVQDVNLSGVSLYYRLNQQIEYIHVEMVKQDQVFTGSIPGQKIGIAIEYFIEAIDSLGNVAYDPSQYLSAPFKFEIIAKSITCDFNGDGKKNISDVISLLLFQRTHPGDLSGDFNKDNKSNVVDAIAMLLAQRNSTCPDSVSAALSSAGAYRQVERIEGLGDGDIEYIQKLLAQFNLTPEEEAASRQALFGNSGKAALPKVYSLAQNSPNPFNPATTISFSVPEGQSEVVTLKVYDLRGQLVRTLVSEVREAGNYSVFWDGTNEAGGQVSSGVYLYRMNAGQFSRTRKMVLLK